MKRNKNYVHPAMKVLVIIVESDVFAGSLDTDPFSVGGVSDASTNAWGESTGASSVQSERSFSLLEDNNDKESIFN